MDDLEELKNLLGEIEDDVQEPKEPKLNILVKDERGKPINLREIRKRVQNPDIVGMTPAQRRRLGLQRKKLIQNLIKPKGYIESGAGVLDLQKLKDAKDNVKELIQRELIEKFYTSDESPYYKWFVLHFVGIDLGDHSLEREYAEKIKLPLWRFLRSAYGETKAKRKVLGNIVKHLRIPYFTSEYSKIGKVKTDIDFADEVKVVEYELDDDERNMKKSSMARLNAIRKEDIKIMKMWLKTGPILKAYWDYLKENNSEQFKEDMEKMRIKTPRDKLRFQSAQLQKLYYDYPSWMPYKYNPSNPSLKRQLKRQLKEEVQNEPQPKRIRVSVFYDSDDEEYQSGEDSEDDIPEFIVYDDI